ncbi:MAG: tetratricopeptide repeat protein [bacterium]
MLKPRKRLTKREIKEDPLVTKYIQVKQFWLHHHKEFNIIFGVIAVVVIVGFLMMRSKKSAEIKANSKLVVPETYYHLNNYERSIPELKSIIEQYPGTHPAGMAVFFLANAYYNQRQYNEAINYFDIYLDDYSDDAIFISSSLSGKAACMENMENYGEAAELYFKAAKKFPHHYMSPYNVIHAVRCFKFAGMDDRGRELCEYAIDKYPDSPVKQKAEYFAKVL